MRKTINLRKRAEEFLGDESEIPPIGPKDPICSSNSKTGFSLNFPAWKTCRPTPACVKVCYGRMRGRPITWSASLRKMVRVHRYFLEADPEEVADKIHGEYVRRKMDFLRWNGVGDLFPKAVTVINVMVEKHPGDVLWVVTRKPELAAKISRKAENLYLMFSLDKSAASRKRRVLISRCRHPRLYYSYIREEMGENTMGARVVFNLQQKKKELEYDDPHTTCPVDAGVLPLNGACTACRRCWTDLALDGTKHPGAA